jgi:CHAT domain-containing protein
VRAARSRVFSASVLGVGSKAAVLTERRDVSRRALESELLVVHPDHVSTLTPRKIARLGSALAELVLGERLCAALAALAEHPLVVVHDDSASRIPWETLRIGKHVPAIVRGLTRQYLARDLSVAKWLEERRKDPELRILLVIDPTEDLPGARAEGKRLRELLGGRTFFRLETIEGSRATKNSILDGFRSGRFDVVHYAGHGFFNPLQPGRSGLLCARDEVLGGADLASSQHLPALVFFNACEVGRVRGRAGGRERRRPARVGAASSAGVAESLLRGGVANYVGTYWEVGDSGAKRFAETFYSALLRGDPIDDAVLRGRRALASAEDSDWADYLHYGPRGYRLKSRSS